MLVKAANDAPATRFSVAILVARMLPFSKVCPGALGAVGVSSPHVAPRTHPRPHLQVVEPVGCMRYGGLDQVSRFHESALQSKRDDILLMIEDRVRDTEEHALSLRAAVGSLLVGTYW